MAELFEFEVRPIEGATADIGEEVTFRSEGGRLYALNEDGEAFGVVPAKFAGRLDGLETATAMVASRSGDVPTVAVKVQEESASENVAAAVSVEAADEMGEDQVDASDEFEQEPETTVPASEVEAEPEADAEQEESGMDSIEPDESDAPAAQNDAAADVTKDSTAKKKPKTKYIAIAAVAAVVIVVIACVVLFSGEKTQTVTSDWLSIEVPEDWTVDSDSDADETYIYPDDFTGLVALCGPNEISQDLDYQYELFEDGTGAIYDGEILEDSAIDDAVVKRLQVESSKLLLEHLDETEELTDYADDEWSGYVYYIYSGTEYMELKVFCLANEYDDHADELEEVLESVVLKDAQEPETVMQTVTDGEISIEVPAGWTVEDETTDSYYLVNACQYDGAQMAILQNGYSLSDLESIDYALLAFEVVIGLDSSTLEQSEYENGAVICRYDYSDEDSGVRGYLDIVFSGDSASLIVVVCTEDEFSEHAETLETILDSLTIENPSEPDFS